MKSGGVSVLANIWLMTNVYYLILKLNRGVENLARDNYALY